MGGWVGGGGAIAGPTINGGGVLVFLKIATKTLGLLESSTLLPC